MQNRTTGKSPFEIVSTKLPRLTVDLANIPSSVDFSMEAAQMAKRIKQLHQEVQDHIKKANSNYKRKADTKRHAQDFKEGDLVMIHLSKGHLPTGSAISCRRSSDPLKKYEPNAYKIELPSYFNISPIFNVPDIHPYSAPDTFMLAD